VLAVNSGAAISAVQLPDVHVHGLSGIGIDKKYLEYTPSVLDNIQVCSYNHPTRSVLLGANTPTH
jgi:hypothetical protein